MESDDRQQALLFSNIAAQLRGALSNLHLAAAQLVSAEAREQDPELDARAALLDQSYWILGSVIGAVAGALIPFSTEGLDFALTALFVVLFLGQLENAGSRIYGLIGTVCSLAVLLLAGADNMVIPSMIVILIVLLIGRKRI